MANEDDSLRERARQLVASRQQHSQAPVSDSGYPKRHRGRELAKAAVAPGAGLVAVLSIVQQLLSSHVSPEQLSTLRERVDQLENDRTARRLTEFERDKIANCRSRQTDGYLQSLLPRRDQQVGQPAKAWFDQCPDLPEPTTGSKAAPKP